MVLRSSLNFTLLIDEILDCLEWYFKKLTLDCSETLTCLLFRLFIQFKFIKELRTTLLDKLSSMSEMFVQVLPNVLEVLDFLQFELTIGQFGPSVLLLAIGSSLQSLIPRG